MRKTMTRNETIRVATAGSVLLLVGALAFEFLGGLTPCTLCLWQRWPHLVAVALGVAALMAGGRVLLWLATVAVLTSAAIALFHVGVEQGWWAGLASCSAGSIAGISTADLLNPEIVVAAPARCDQVAWSFAGLSMAAWNGVISVGLGVIWLKAARTWP